MEKYNFWTIEWGNRRTRVEMAPTTAPYSNDHYLLPAWLKADNSDRADGTAYTVESYRLLCEGDSVR